MKTIKYSLSLGLLLSLASCADDQIVDFKTAKPESMAQYEYLNAYDALKTYVDRSASPDFKLGIALSASDFLKGEVVRAMAVSNFDEMTAGNAMKYASVVGDDGTMDFSTIYSFVDEAKAAGLTIYGHTLGWHAQQNNKYLNGLIKDKEVEVDPDKTKTVEDAFFDYSTFTAYSYWNQKPAGAEISISEEGYLKSSNPVVIDNFWDFQYHIADGILWAPGITYQITTMIRASEDCEFTIAAGTWDGSANDKISVTTEWKEVTLSIAPQVEGKGFVMFQSGNFAGTIEMQWLKVTHEEAIAATVDKIDAEFDYSTFSSYSYWNQKPAGAEISISEEGYLKSYNPVAISNFWDFQYHVADGITWVSNITYKVTTMIRASENCEFTIVGGTWAGNVAGKLSVTTEWKEVSVSLRPESEGDGFVMFQSGNFGGTIEMKWLKVSHEEAASVIPLTPEEKKDTLTWAMNNWVEGMMKATGGYVTAWDVVNEAISGGGDDGEGFYVLQSAKNVSANDAKNNFYWQDYLGNEDYVRIVVAAARKYYAENGGTEPLKLFINDYNLESDWDDNKKVKSLVHWIEKWEADGVTKIDGIGTQMHVSCYANADTQKSKEDHVVKMFEIMAASGKLVKISELDMGYIDENGNSVKTADMTEAQHKAMAEYYKFIVKKYFEIIPAAQQYGITQWCATDAPTDSGWRGGEPVGLWDANYNRKHTYAGFADGLAGK